MNALPVSEYRATSTLGCERARSGACRQRHFHAVVATVASSTTNGTTTHSYQNHLHNGSITIVDVHQREAGKLVCDLSRRVNDVAHMADDPGGDMAETTSDDIAAAASLR